MLRIKIAALVSALMMLATTGLASAQTAYDTPFATSITFQNVGTGPANVQFSFYNEKAASPTVVNRNDIAAGSGSSLFVGGLSGGEALPPAFKGSAVLSANQPIVATLVQIAQPSATSPVKNRPLSNGFNSASASVLLATVLKNQFRTTSVFSVQNADTSSAIDITVELYDADNPGNAPIVLSESNIPVGAAKYYDMGKLAQVSATSFNGSAKITAVKSGTPNPANIVASVMELSTNSLSAKAFEGVTGGGTKIFMATALCDIFADKQRTAYAVQNNGTTDAAVTVTYARAGSAETFTQNATIGPGRKASLIACDVTGANFTGSATIDSAGADIVVIGKAFAQPAIPGFETAFLGEVGGVAKLALPYVRWTNDASFSAGSGQRTFIAIQNVGTTPATGVSVRYLDKTGAVVGTETIASIAPGGKDNSTPIEATGDLAKLTEFGNPASNPGGGFGGAVIIESTGGQLIAVARVASRTGPAGVGVLVAEDYNGIPVN